MAKITNLIGTTWRLSFTDVPAGYGKFNIEYGVKIVGDSYGFISEEPYYGLTLFAPGFQPYIYNDEPQTLIEEADCVSVYDATAILDEPYLNIGGLEQFFGTPFDIFIIITGGTDVENSLLVDFLNTYGTLVSGGEPPTAESVKSKLQSLITASNAKTGKSDANLTDAVNTLIEGYGQGGGFGGGGDIIEVDQLPTENISTTALYKVGESYYRYVDGAFTDIIVVETEGSAPYSLLELYSALGVTPELYTIKTKPTTEEGLAEIVKTDFATGVIAIYYIEDEGDAFTYDGSAWSAMGAIGIISDVSEATAVGMYILAGAYWVEYVAPSGSLTITENSTVDVTDKVSVTVNVPTTYMVQTVAELPTDAADGSMAIVLGGK